jgi:cardiolipin synthase
VHAAWLTLPNVITLGRLALVPWVVAALAAQSYGWALAGFFAAAVSDAVDGILARLLDQRSRLGAVLDAVADKLIIFSTLVMLALAGFVPHWLAALLVGRDALMLAAIAVYRVRAGRVEIAPLFAGKLHVFLQFALLTLILAHAAGVADCSRWFPSLFLLVAATAGGSFVLYVVVWRRRLRTATRLALQRPER